MTARTEVAATAGPGPGRGGDRQSARRRALARFRPTSSILLKVVVALVVVLLVASGFTAIVADRLNKNALASQARQLAKGHLTVLQEAYSERERTLLVSLRNLAETLNADGLTNPQRRPELIAELGRAQGNLELDLVRAIDTQGRELIPTGGGTPLQSSGLMAPQAITPEPASRLLATAPDRFIQAVAIPVGAGQNRFTLIGGYEFSDAFAYRLRRQIGSLDNVILVAGGRTAGTTLPERPATPPGIDDDDDGDDRFNGLPRSPTEVRLDTGKALVAYVPLGRSGDSLTGALGVALVDPTAALNRSLSQARLFTSLLLALLAVALGWLLFRALIKPLVQLSSTAVNIARGDLDASFEPRGHDEIAMLAGSLEHMRIELRNKIDLIAHQAAVLQETSQRIVTAQDEERHRLARDLHDGIQQQLVVLRMQLGMLEDGGGFDPKACRALEDLGRQLDGTIEQLREVTHNLYPSILVDRGLAAALRSYIGRLPVTTRLTCSPEQFPRLPLGIESGAYFLLGEAVTNALKHSGASEIAIDLSLRNGQLELAITDDGRGFVVGDEAGGGGGVLHMHDRVRSFGGHLTIASKPGHGTTVRAALPVDAFADTGSDGDGAPAIPHFAAGRTAPPPHGG